MSVLLAFTQMFYLIRPYTMFIIILASEIERLIKAHGKHLEHRPTDLEVMGLKPALLFLFQFFFPFQLSFAIQSVVLL